jgi:ABC-2 type transport system permease protein
VRALLATARGAFLEAAARRGALALQMTVMILNDATWVAFWVIFFHRVGRLHGYDTTRILLLQAVLTTAGGITLGFFNNARHLGSMALDGQLDAALALPTRPLGHLLLRRVEPTNLGDLCFGVVLFLVAGHPTPARALTFVLVVALSAALLTGFLVLTGASAFFVGRSEGGELGFHGMLLLGSYPVDVFGGVAKILVFTVIPAAFVAAVPARMVADPDPRLLGGLAVAAATFALGGATAFHLGLRRYASGSVWTRA